MRFTFLYIIIVGTYVNNAIVLNEMKAISIVFSFFSFQIIVPEEHIKQEKPEITVYF